ncbi:MAG: IS4 family transposase [Longimicrobiales bacterium]
MRLSTALECVGEIPRPENLDCFVARLDKAWITRALAARGGAAMRRRRLPAEQVVWIVIGMALLRNRSIPDVVDTLDLALPGEKLVTPQAIVGARDRLGEAPIEWLFRTSAAHWVQEDAAAHRWRGLQVCGVDGTTLRVAASDANRRHFGTPRNGGSEGAYPQVRVVALLDLRTHLILAAKLAPYSESELSTARQLWPEVPPRSICIVDRLYFAADLLLGITQRGTDSHFLIRARRGTKWDVIKTLGKNDFIVTMRVSKSARDRDPSLPAEWTARAIRYRRKGFREQWVLTSLLDAEAYPAAEIVALYHERWELELGFDEIKTETLDREETLRSRTPARVLQEIWGLLIAYNLVRLEMKRFADEAGVPPTRISFVTSLRLICDEWIWCSRASPGVIGRNLQRLRQKLQRLVLPPRRSSRSYSRTVKLSRSSYPAR